MGLRLTIRMGDSDGLRSAAEAGKQLIHEMSTETEKIPREWPRPVKIQLGRNIRD